MIERTFDVRLVAPMAQREKQIQQNYRPIIAVHKWFARRPGTLFRALLLSEFAKPPLADAYYGAHALSGLHIGDPFMGGGTPLIEANRLGCDIIGMDINPMSYWIVRQEIEHIDLEEYGAAADSLRDSLEAELGHLYRTRCEFCGSPDAHVKYFLWVKSMPCKKCGHPIDLFQDYLVASNRRHPRYVLVCPSCDRLVETESRSTPAECPQCGSTIPTKGPAARGHARCGNCGTVNGFPQSGGGPPDHHLFAIEYYCPACRKNHRGRYFKAPDADDRQKLIESSERLEQDSQTYVPHDAIPTGDETNRLHRWGYTRYSQLFNQRQLLGLARSAAIISNIHSQRVRDALATNLSDLLRYQNMLCRYDTVALKSLDIFSIHGFPVGLVQCESNLLGISDTDREVPVGSGGWLNIIEKYRKAKAYCVAPFEIRYKGRAKQIVRLPGEWIGEESDTHPVRRSVDLRCADAATAALPANSLDAVMTDPPYYGNVQYAELMDFCYVWLRNLVGSENAAFAAASTRATNELTVNEDMGRGLEHFTEGLSAAFQNMARALKRGRPFCFTYHHNRREAYYPVIVALLDSGLVCTAALPCPGEMGASIHINGTGSSTLDTVFICRGTGLIQRRTLPLTIDGVAGLVEDDTRALHETGVRTTDGDARCLTFGHIARLAIWYLRPAWNASVSVSDKLAAVRQWIDAFGDWPQVQDTLRAVKPDSARLPVLLAVREDTSYYGADDVAISF